VNRFRAPLSVRLALWIIVFSLGPLLTAYMFMGGQMREAYTAARLEKLENQVRTYSAGLEHTAGGEQVLIESLQRVLPEDQFFLLGLDGRYIAHSDPSKIGASAFDDLGERITNQLLAREAATFVNNDLMLASYRRSLTDPVAVSFSSLSRGLAPLSRLTTSIVLQLIFGLVAIAVAAGFVMHWMLSPSSQISRFAAQLGNREFLATLDTLGFRGEMALIAESLKDLSEKIKTLVQDLEQRVVDRTRELEQRAVQLRATADVSKAITSVRNLEELLQQTTALINERFGYYHVGIFLLDERKEYAVLSASNSAGGTRMLEKKHQLKVGEAGLVGYATANARARIALDVGQDAVFFDNPDLPHTRSEIALPLIASGQILGALDAQSTEPQAFTEDDIATLQSLADQIALAIQNANLFNETEKALETARQGFGEVSRDAWKRMMRYQPRVGFLATLPGAIETHSEIMESSMSTAFRTGDIVFSDDGLSISLPIRIRGETIGAIRLNKSEIAEAWTQEETNLAISLSDQLSGALESARLYKESQQRAARESLVSDISARIGASSRVEAIVRETVQELGQVIGNVRVTFQLQDESNGSAQAKKQRRDGISAMGKVDDGGTQ